MIETTVQQEVDQYTVNMEAKQIRTYVEGYEQVVIEHRGYGLTTTERAEVEAEAITIYQS